MVRLPFSLSRPQGCDCLRDPLCASFGPLRSLDPTHKVLAIERGQRLEEPTYGRLGGQSSSDVVRHRSYPRPFRTQQDFDLLADNHRSVATPRRAEIQVVSTSACYEFAPNLL